QLLFTSFVLANLGMRTALLITPIAILVASAGFLALPTVMFGSALSASDHSLNYTINQSAREALYTPVSRREKYTAQAFIDMFVQRFGKAAAVGVNVVMTFAFTSFNGVRYLSLVVMALAGMWIGAAAYVGKRFHQLG